MSDQQQQLQLQPQAQPAKSAQPKRYQVLALLDNPKIVSRLEQAAPGMSGQIIINVINACNDIPDLFDCEPNSVVNAAMQAAALGLSLSKSLGQACILPYNGKNGKRASLIVQVRGIKKLAIGTNKYRFLNAFRVYEGQEMVENQMTGVHEMRGNRTSNRVKGFGAYFQLYGGLEASVYWSVERLLDWAKKPFCKSPQWKDLHADGQLNFDGQGFANMGLKTAMKDLILNHGVISDRDRAALENIAEERQEEGAELVEATFSPADMADETEDEPKTARSPEQNLADLGY